MRLSRMFVFLVLGTVVAVSAATAGARITGANKTTTITFWNPRLARERGPAFGAGQAARSIAAPATVSVTSMLPRVAREYGQS
jgi:hypothetical protein